MYINKSECTSYAVLYVQVTSQNVLKITCDYKPPSCSHSWCRLFMPTAKGYE